jgi:hypothetical protein
MSNKLGLVWAGGGGTKVGGLKPNNQIVQGGRGGKKLFRLAHLQSSGGEGEG